MARNILGHPKGTRAQDQSSCRVALAPSPHTTTISILHLSVSLKVLCAGPVAPDLRYSQHAYAKLSRIIERRLNQQRLISTSMGQHL